MLSPSDTTERSRILPTKWTLLILLVGAANIIVETLMFTKLNIQECWNDDESEYNIWPVRNSFDTAAGGSLHLDRILGHLHYAKTAGTDVNAQLAARYERVCGHKGYSYDAFQFHQRLKKKAVSRQRPLGLNDGGPDIVTHFKKSFNRGRLPWSVMKEIGFENCDYVSLERPWQDWIPIAKMWPVELHVPCREPVEHLMSQCNHIHRQFDCHASDLVEEVRGCFVLDKRFRAELTQVPNLTMKCFKAKPVEPYLEYMDQVRFGPPRWQYH